MQRIVEGRSKVSETALTRMDPGAWEVMRQQAATLLKSGFLPKSITTPEQAIAVMMKGVELGIGPMEALSGINVILGKPAVSPQLMLALARRTRELTDFQVSDDGNSCKVTIQRKGMSPITTQFSMEDAKGMGLASKDNWIKQPKVMRQWRAVAANLRISFPDAIAGLYTPEELGAEVDTDEDGHMTIKEPAPDPVVKAAEIEGAVVTVHSKNEEVSGAVISLLKQKASADTRERTDTQIGKMRTLLVLALEELIVSPRPLDTYTKEHATQMRHIFQQAVFGEQSAEQWTGAQIAAVLDWLQLEKTKDSDGKTKYVSSSATLLTVKPGLDAVLAYEAEKRGQMKLLEEKK